MVVDICRGRRNRILKVRQLLCIDDWPNSGSNAKVALQRIVNYAPVCLCCFGVFAVQLHHAAVLTVEFVTINNTIIMGGLRLSKAPFRVHASAAKRFFMHSRLKRGNKMV